MAFKVKAGKVKTAWLPVTASTAIARGALVTFSSGKLVAATAQTANAAIVGVLDKAIVATDADYATDLRLVPVIVPIEKHVLFEGDVTSGLVVGDIGTECDLTDASTVDRAGSTYDVAKCVGVISSTKGNFWLKINGSY
jgi:hypothetical protein